MRKLAALSLAIMLSLPTVSWAGNVTVSATAPSYDSPGQKVIATWAHLTSTNPTGTSWTTGKYRLLEVQIKGTWGAGTVVVQGSDDNTNWLTLTGLPLAVPTAISYAADPTVLIPVWETPNYVKCTLSGANGTDDITVTVTGRN